MRTRTADFYDAFTCLAQDCPDTCCANWRIPIDAQTRKKYRVMRTPLGTSLRRALRDGYFKNNRDGRCPFLTDEGLCELILQTRSQAILGQVCRIYPRKVAEYGAYREISLSVSCPRAAQLTLESEQLCFVVRESEELPTLHDLDPQRFAALVRLKETCIRCVQTPTKPLENRVRELLTLAEIAPRSQSQARRRARFFGLFVSMEWSDCSMKKEIRMLRRQSGACTARAYAALETAYPRWRHDLTNLLAYCLDRYMLEAAQDEDAAGRVRLSVLWCWMLYELACTRCLRQGSFSQADMQRLVVQFARQTEHSDRNLRILLRRGSCVL